MLLGAAVGISFAFLGRIAGRLGLYSQLTGVVPGHQGRGIGLMLSGHTHGGQLGIRDRSLLSPLYAYLRGQANHP